jgi:hypothetical protein
VKGQPTELLADPESAQRDVNDDTAAFECEHEGGAVERSGEDQGAVAGRDAALEVSANALCPGAPLGTGHGVQSPVVRSDRCGGVEQAVFNGENVPAVGMALGIRAGFAEPRRYLEVAGGGRTVALAAHACDERDR